ncbi:MAG TPA: peptidoglycan-binding protein, partial [Polyangium sp.]|nr:peptidoglycan-binding protein [Polyangium sp.]
MTLKLDKYITDKLTSDKGGLCTQGELDTVWADVSPYVGKTVRDVGAAKCLEIAAVLAGRFEGCLTHMYCDHLGLVTIGIGLLLDGSAKSALDSLPLTVKSTNAAASASDKKKDWDAAKAHFNANSDKPPIASKYASLMKCQISEETARKKCTEVMKSKADSLFNTSYPNTKQHEGGYLDYPAIAWALVINLAFAVGNSGLDKFKNMNKAIKEKNWETAAKESWVKDHSRLTLGARYQLLLLCGGQGQSQSTSSGPSDQVILREPTTTFDLKNFSQEQLYDHLRDVWKRSQKRFGNEGKAEFDFQDEEGRMNLLGARGFEFDTMVPVPSTNTKYDDCLFLVYKKDGKKAVSKFQCTTEWTSAGASAVILLGQHKYKLAVHKKDREYKKLAGVKAYADIKGFGYRALNPDPHVKCTRITNASNVGAVGESAASTHDNASINIHYGGEKNTVADDRAGAWSEGCQVLSGMANYLRFIQLLETDHSLKNTTTNELSPKASKDGTRSLIYTLVEGDALSPRRSPISFPVALKDSRVASPENAAAYYAHTEVESKGGYYPLGANTVWHGGVHLHVAEGTQVVAPYKGKVIAARLPSDPKKAITHYGSMSFVLLQHEIDGATLNKTAPRGKVIGYRATQDVNVRAKATKSADKVGVLKEGDRVDLVTDKYTSADGFVWAQVTVTRAADAGLKGKKGFVAVKGDWFQSYHEAVTFPKLDEKKQYKFWSLYMHLGAVKFDGSNELFKAVKWLHAPKPATEPASTDTISASVGEGGINKAADVRKVQTRLQKHGKYKGAIQDACDQATKDAIKTFQSAWAKKPDGRVDPGGTTWGKLCQPPPPAGNGGVELDAALVKELDKGVVAKVDREVETGDVLWLSGLYGSTGARTGMVHWEIFSEELVLPWAKKVEDMDDDFNMDCDAILKMVEQDEVSWSFYDENEILSVDELHRFYKTNPKSRDLRNYACRFISEWAVDLSKAIPAMKGRFNTWGLEDRLKPSIWWQEAQGKKVPMPASPKVWHYNPITFLYRVALASGEAAPQPAASSSAQSSSSTSTSSPTSSNTSSQTSSSTGSQSSSNTS